jgi:hypothetical protein
MKFLSQTKLVSWNIAMKPFWLLEWSSYLKQSWKSAMKTILVAGI